MDLTRELTVCKKLAQEVGKVILEIYQQDFSVEYKEDESPLTSANKKANELMIEWIR